MKVSLAGCIAARNSARHPRAAGLAFVAANLLEAGHASQMQRLARIVSISTSMREVFRTPRHGARRFDQKCFN
jgi:hypothetical protein